MAKAKRTPPVSLIAEFYRADFTTHQTAQLRQLGLFEEQIAALRSLLPLLVISFTPTPSISPVRKRVLATRASLRTASANLLSLIEDDLGQIQGQAFPNLKTARAKSDDLWAARHIRELVSRRTWNMKSDILNKTRTALEELCSVLDRVCDELPQQQRQHSNTMAIQFIEIRLEQGFVAHYNPNWPQEAAKPFPHNELKASRTGRFAEVVRTCYEAAGRMTDPDREIRAYMDWKDALIPNRPRYGILAPDHLMGKPIKKRGRPRKKA